MFDRHIYGTQAERPCSKKIEDALFIDSQKELTLARFTHGKEIAMEQFGKFGKPPLFPHSQFRFELERLARTRNPRAADIDSNSRELV